MIIEIYGTQYFQNNIKNIIFPSILMFVKTISPVNHKTTVYFVCVEGKTLGYLGDKSCQYLTNKLEKIYVLKAINPHTKYKHNLLLEINLMENEAMCLAE